MSCNLSACKYKCPSVMLNMHLHAFSFGEESVIDHKLQIRHIQSLEGTVIVKQPEVKQYTTTHIHTSRNTHTQKQTIQHNLSLGLSFSCFCGSSLTISGKTMREKLSFTYPFTIFLHFQLLRRQQQHEYCSWCLCKSLHYSSNVIDNHLPTELFRIKSNVEKHTSLLESFF